VIMMELTPVASRNYGRPMDAFLESMIANQYEIYIAQDYSHGLKPFDPVVKGNRAWNAIITMEPGGLLDVMMLHIPSITKILDGTKTF